MLSAVSSPNLPAIDSNFGVTSDLRLGWRFMECLDSEVETMDKVADAQYDIETEDVSKRCHRAITSLMKFADS